MHVKIIILKYSQDFLSTFLLYFSDFEQLTVGQTLCNYNWTVNYLIWEQDRVKKRIQIEIVHHMQVSKNLEKSILFLYYTCHGHEVSIARLISNCSQEIKGKNCCFASFRPLCHHKKTIYCLETTNGSSKYCVSCIKALKSQEKSQKT